jgi:hypothetical protein
VNEPGNEFLLLDDRIVETTESLQLELGRVTKHPANPLFEEEFFADPPKRWEARFDNLYPNVLYDEEAGLFKLWYNVFTKDPASEETPLHARGRATYHTGAGGRRDGLLYATSEDGVAWTKPALGLVAFEGSRANNLVMDTDTHAMHGVGVFKDLDDPDPERRYKALFRGKLGSGDGIMAVALSADGLRWTPAIPWPEHDAIGDTHNYAFRTPSGFVGISRDWIDTTSGRLISRNSMKFTSDSLRVVVRTESQDFVRWSEPQVVLQGEDAHDQIYSMPVAPYANLYLGLPASFHDGDRNAADWDLVDTELAWSPDTVRWNRVRRGEALIPRGEGSYPDGTYDCGCIYAAAPLLVGDTVFLYYGGSNGKHTDFREGSFNLATLPRGRFAGYTTGASAAAGADARGGLTTREFTLERGGIGVNVEVASGGLLRAGLMGSEGGFLDGFGPEACRPIRQGGLDVALNWSGGTPPAGRALRLAFELERTTLYALSGDLDFRLPSGSG